MVNWVYDQIQTVHNHLFFRKTVEIEDFALRVAILECQIYLGGGGRFGRSQEK